MRRLVALILLVGLMVGILSTAADAKYVSRPRPTPTCGDGSCNGSETSGSCPMDCGR